MKILLGTDIFLYSKIDKSVEDGLSILFKWAEKLQHNVCLDYATWVSVQQFFPNLKKIPNQIKGIFNYPPKKQHFKNIENSFSSNIQSKPLVAQLNLLDHGIVDIIVTEDSTLHKMAQSLSLYDSIYSLDEFLEKCEADNRSLDPNKGEVIEKSKLGCYNINDLFFKSFKEDYSPYYEQWFHNKENDEIYVSTDKNGSLQALLKLKLENENENYSDVQPIFTPKKRLKISSLKVNYTGNKVTERFMRIIISKAFEYGVEEIYGTILNNSRNKRRLKGILEMWGFRYFGMKGDEQVYVKAFRKKTTGNLIADFPFHKANSNIFIVPLSGWYSRELVPGYERRNDEKDIEPYKHAIKKTLVLHQDDPRLIRGAILLFYDLSTKAIVAIGTIDDVFKNIRSEKEFVMKCRKRSILDETQLKYCWQKYGPEEKSIVVNFLYTYSFPITETVDSKTLEILGIQCQAFEQQIIYPINEEQFNGIIKDSFYEQNIIVH